LANSANSCNWQQTGFSRRSFLIASSGLLLPKLTWTQASWKSILYWKLAESGDTAQERNSTVEDPIASRTGHATWVGSGRDRALRLDGYSVWVNHQTAPLPLSGNALTICAWVALESSPVNDAAIVHLDGGQDAGVGLGVDRLGYLFASIGRGESSAKCKSSQRVPKAEWRHVAAAFAGSRTTLYIDGEPCGTEPATASPVRLPRTAETTIGKAPDAPVIAGVFPTSVLNGLLREVHIFDGVLTERDLGQIIEQSKPGRPPDLQINAQWCADDPQRPVYHAMPPRAWTNEPHGLIEWGGKYHLFYQKNPNGPYWGHINWGHMTSPDLYCWTEMPVALSPEPGPDSEGCWSGSVIDYNGKLAIIYTAGDGHRASICLALSQDGIRFAKHPGNPVIAQPPDGHGYPEFRDPFVWREGESFYLIIGSAITGKGGTALLYRSKDLINWEFRKPLLAGDRETSGVFWEMPVFIKVGDQHALIVCEVPGRASYWVGTWKDETFTPVSACPHRLELFNHLLSPTPHTLEDGRVIAMGIIPDERSPKECWRAGWAHHYSLPRLISADALGRLHQSPYEGIEKWSETVASLAGVPLSAMKPIEQASGNRLRLRAVFKRGGSQSLTLSLRASPDGREHTDLHYHWDIGRLILDRSQSSLDPMVKRDTLDATCFPDTPDRVALDVFLDESVLEVFVDQRSAFAARIYPTLDSSSGILMGAEGPGAILETLTISRIKQTNQVSR
jgi:sucrose-6-phosphate hydrolase SacC (GH32 family)